MLLPIDRRSGEIFWSHVYNQQVKKAKGKVTYQSPFCLFGFSEANPTAGQPGKLMFP